MFGYFTNLHEKSKSRYAVWLKTTPKQKWQLVYDVTSYVVDLIGIRVLSDLKYDWLTPAGVIIGVDLFLSSFYSIYYYSERGEYGKTIQCTCILGAAAVSLTKYWLGVGPNRTVTKEYCRYGGKYIHVNSNEKTKFVTVCNESAKELTRNAILVSGLVVFSNIQIAIGPLYAYLMHGHMSTPLGTFLPFTGGDSKIGFIINMGHQGLIAVYMLFGAIGIEIISCIVINVFDLSPQLIQLNMEELEVDLLADGWSFRAKMQLRNILVQIQDLDRYILGIIDLYYVNLFIGPYLLTSSISISIISQLIWDFPSGFGIAIWCYFQLINMCYMGQKVQNANQIILESLYNMPWYSMPKLYQKDIAHMMNRLQNGAVLTMGPFADLNYETASNFTKIIYNFTMLLYSFAR